MYGKCRAHQAGCGGSRDLLLESRARLGFELKEHYKQRSTRPVSFGSGVGAWPSTHETWQHRDVPGWPNLPPCLLLSPWSQSHVSFALSVSSDLFSFTLTFSKRYWEQAGTTLLPCDPLFIGSRERRPTNSQERESQKDK